MALIEKRKCVHLSIDDKLVLIKKLEAGVSVSRVCEIYGVKKQTVSDIRKAKDKLRKYAVKFNVDSTKDKKGVIHARRHMRQPQSKELEEAVYKWYKQQCSVKVNVRGVELMAGEGSSSDKVEEVAIKPKLSRVRESLDVLINYVDLCDSSNIQGYYEHLRTLRELVIREQYQRVKQSKLDTFFKRKTPEAPHSEPQTPEPPHSEPPHSEPQPSEPQPSTSKGSSVATTSALDFIGFESEDSDSE
ncbi:hypothetical protein Pmani_001254 [Petrolisthes manimaculis]|uniref:HTH psq-type domain-containing protein n=1 Tax=Petrolisthes manimaculis TaxID=1843537 RepID=A0AAE1QMJ6_9EUCA|nr:hypothetical protein Pmani_001254 [Petrolisthes manimaculis]